MVKEIKVIDKNEIFDNKNNLVVLPYNGNNNFITVEEAQDLVSILKGQINIIEAKNVRDKSDGKNKTGITRKTGGDAGGAE